MTIKNKKRKEKPVCLYKKSRFDDFLFKSKIVSFIRKKRLAHLLKKCKQAQEQNLDSETIMNMESKMYALAFKITKDKQFLQWILDNHIGEGVVTITD